MAKAYVKVYVNGKHLRIYGGNKPDVKGMKEFYNNVSRQDFNKCHPHVVVKGIFNVETQLVI